MADSTLTPITFEGHNYYPVWSPDGERVAYSSETSESVDLRWTRSDGTGAWETLLSNGEWNYPETFSLDGGHSPVWSRDGQLVTVLNWLTELRQAMGGGR